MPTRRRIPSDLNAPSCGVPFDIHDGATSPRLYFRCSDLHLPWHSVSEGLTTYPLRTISLRRFYAADTGPEHERVSPGLPSSVSRACWFLSLAPLTFLLFNQEHDVEKEIQFIDTSRYAFLQERCGVSEGSNVYVRVSLRHSPEGILLPSRCPWQFAYAPTLDTMSTPDPNVIVQEVASL